MWKPKILVLELSESQLCRKRGNVSLERVDTKVFCGCYKKVSLLSSLISAPGRAQSLVATCGKVFEGFKSTLELQSALQSGILSFG